MDNTIVNLQIFDKNKIKRISNLFIRNELSFRLTITDDNSVDEYKRDILKF